MRVTHEFKLTARCPVDATFDTYIVTVETDHQIDVEHILKTAASCHSTEEYIYQEDLTQRLATQLELPVTTRGTHSAVVTTVTCEP